MEERLREILKEVREIEIESKKVVNTLFGGEYKSSFKGRGVEFHEVRDYFPGDDIRTIDWNVTARMNHPFVKRFIEERELTILIIADCSGSGEFGSRKEQKKDLIARISALFSFSAIKNNDKVGLILFSDKVEHYLPPRKGRAHTLHLIRDILVFSPESRETDPVPAMEFSINILPHGAIVLLVSDFIGRGFGVEHIRMPLSLMAKKFDLIPLIVRDPFEVNPDLPGRIMLKDAESGGIQMFNGRELKGKFIEIRDARDEKLHRLFNINGLDRIHITSGEDYIAAIHRLFQRRLP
ncbi:MAG: DUF58 domain-containing protein [candidate division WOR-3 bacterium]|nr:DUF58 domain-containing protein [candidate division WOR-3 bacterium]